MTAWDLLLQIAQTPAVYGVLGAAGGSVATVAAGAMKVVAEPLLVPAAKVIGDDLAERMRERVEARRRAVAARAVELAGTDPKGVLTDRTLVNVMQGAATVDDPDIQEMFARLLASEATGTAVHPSFPSIIASMTSNEARLLRELLLGDRQILITEVPGTFSELGPGFLRVYHGGAQQQQEVAVANLVRLGLLREDNDITGLPDPGLEDEVEEAVRCTQGFRRGSGGQRLRVRTTALGDEFAIAVGVRLRIGGDPS